MSSYDELLVGALAIIFAIVALVISAGPWDAPYRLRTISAVASRFGKPAARGIWVAVAVAAFASGLAIFSGTRPSYATQTQHSALEDDLNDR
ncbi:MAG: hypothetical protein HKN47_04625 [Pirellulaceae bacterium]|nr:hypothetical protein [Pirellulaceae bacterium]